MTAVIEPYKQGLTPREIRLNRVFSFDNHMRDVSSARSVIQHIHGNPLFIKVMKPKRAVRHGYYPIDHCQRGFILGNDWKKSKACS